MLKEAILAVMILILGAVLAFMEPNFLNEYNVHSMLTRIGMYGVFSIGCGIVIITGGIDLSVGSIFALMGIVLTILLREFHMAWPLAVALVLLGNMLIGAFNGFMVTKVGLQPFLVTLCGLLFYRSQARVIAGDTDRGFGMENFGLLETLTKGKVFIGGGYDIPAAFFVLVAVALVMWVVLHHSVYGRYLRAVGRNEEATRFSGVNTKLVIGSAYVICMVLTTISGVLFLFDTRSVSPTTFGQTYELWGIAAAVLGGCSLRGGEGSIVGIVLGTVLLQLLMNLVNLLGFKSAWEWGIMGSVILFAVLVDQLVVEGKRRGWRIPGM